MRKTISNGINRRAVYKFKCTGPCGKQKSTYVYDRAKAGVCLSCSKNTVDPNQSSLFPDGSVFLSEDGIVFKDNVGGKITLDMKNGEVRGEQEDGSGFLIKHTAGEEGGF